MNANKNKIVVCVCLDPGNAVFIEKSNSKSTEKCIRLASVLDTSSGRISNKQKNLQDTQDAVCVSVVVCFLSSRKGKKLDCIDKFIPAN